MRVHANWFRTPSDTGEMKIRNLPFKPDVVQFFTTNTVTEMGQDEDGDGGSMHGEGRGYADYTGETIRNLGMSEASGSSSPNGHWEASTDNYSLFQILTSSDGASITGWIEAEVIDMGAGNFTLDFSSSDRETIVFYEAYMFEKGESFHCDFINQRTSTGIQEINDPEFRPNLLLAHTTPHNDEVNNQSGGNLSEDNSHGWSYGWATESKQFTISWASSSENRDSHVSAGFENEFLHPVWAFDEDGLAGEVAINLDSFHESGFNLEYIKVDPENGSGHPILYAAFNTKNRPVITNTMTLEENGIQEILQGRSMHASIYVNNTVPGFDDTYHPGESRSGRNGNFGFSQGYVTDSVDAFSMGYTSNHDSTNDHRRYSTNSPIYFQYADRNGSKLGEERGELDQVTSLGIDWTSVDVEREDPEGVETVAIGCYAWQDRKVRIDDLNKGLIGHWTMNDIDIDGGKLRDSTSHDAHGDFGSNIITGTDSPVGQSFDFLNTNDHIHAPDLSEHTGISKMTIAAWFKDTGVEDSETIFSKHDSGEDGNWYISVDENQDIWMALITDEQGRTNLRGGNESYNEDQWHLVVGTFDGSEQTLYLDGELIASQTYSGEVNQSGYGVGIGAIIRRDDDPNPYWQFNGKISDCRYYNRVLSESEIKRLYNMRNKS